MSINGPASVLCCEYANLAGMEESKPSRTAYRVALRRAAHQIADDPVVFADPLAIRILGKTPTDLRAPERPSSQSLRAFIVARAACAEEALAAAVARGVTQYVLLGAGLDTFAYRNPYPELHVFEVDHPATQQWKHGLLTESGIAVPVNAHHVPVDFERDSLTGQLQAHGYHPGAITQFSWLGVVPYLTRQPFEATLKFAAAHPAGSGLVLDYALPRDLLPAVEQREFDSLADRVRLVAEPFRLFFSPEEMTDRLEVAGFHVTDHLDKTGINRRYFSFRPDGLAVLGSAGRLVSAVRVG